MGYDVDMGCIICCDERVFRKIYGNKEKLVCGISIRFFLWKLGDGMW